MKLYLAGPMTGLPEHNFPAFNRAASMLRAAGHEVINPVDINGDTATPWADCLRADIEQLIKCDGIALLPGWDKSKGASLECFIAKALGMPLTYLWTRGGQFVIGGALA
jgi:nucleoside 2-deoxyribosyltransferase